MACPQVGDVPFAPAVSAALMACSSNTSGSGGQLRLGFHAASSSSNPAAARGMAAALQLIEQEGVPGVGSTYATYYPISTTDPSLSPVATRAALELVQQERVHAVIGGGSSAVSVLAQHIFANSATPQVAYSSTGVALTSREQYPTFSRVVSADQRQGLALAAVCHEFGWRYVGVLSTGGDVYAAGVRAVFLSSLAVYGGYTTVLRDLSVAPPSFNSLGGAGFLEEYYTDLVQTVRDARLRVLVLILSTPAEAALFMLELARQGLDDVVLLGVDAWMTD